MHTAPGRTSQEDETASHNAGQKLPVRRAKGRFAGRFKLDLYIYINHISCTHQKKVGGQCRNCATLIASGGALAVARRQATLAGRRGSVQRLWVVV